jgi:hypothetical protein
VTLAVVAAAKPDLSPTEFIAPHFYIRPGWQIPTIRVSNLGSTAAFDFPVVCRIDSSGRAIYQCTTKVAGPLLPGRDSAYRFRARTLAGWFSSYGIRFWTAIADDSVPRNDTAATWFEVGEWALSDTLIESYGGGGASVDGRIDYSEYSYPGPTDISDQLGRNGVVPAGPGTCMLYVSHDFDYTYFGFDFRNVLRRQDGDLVRVWMDENYDGRFGPAGDSFEGFHTAFIRGGIDSLTYWLMPGVQCPGCTSASSTRNGNLQFEMRVPFGPRPGDYDVDFWWDIAGIGLQAELAELGTIAWWPQRVPPGRMGDPSRYGAFEWVEVVGAEERTRGGVPKTALPTIVRGVLFLPTASSRELQAASLLDASGRKVLDLQAGPTDVSGLAPGVYFVHSTVDNRQSEMTKVVIAQ